MDVSFRELVEEAKRKGRTEEKRKKVEFWHSAFIFMLIVSLTIVFGSIPLLCFGINEHAGYWGDSFGVINAIVSGLAFAGVIITLVMQREELQLQRKELEETRKELKRSASAQEKTEEQLQRQAELMAVSSYISALSSLDEGYQQMRKEDRSEVELTYLKAIHGDVVTRLEQVVSRFDKQAEEHLEGQAISTRFTLRRLAMICLSAHGLLQSRVTHMGFAYPLIEDWKYKLNYERFYSQFSKLFSDTSWLTRQMKRDDKSEDALKLCVRTLNILTGFSQSITSTNEYIKKKAEENTSKELEYIQIDQSGYNEVFGELTDCIGDLREQCKIEETKAFNHLVTTIDGND